MDSDEECAAAFTVIAIIVKKRKLMRKKLNRQKRSVWVRPCLVRRNELGADSTLLQEFRLEEGDEYQRISPQINELFCFFNSLALCSHLRIQRDEKNCLADGVKPLKCSARH